MRVITRCSGWGFYELLRGVYRREFLCRKTSTKNIAVKVFFQILAGLTVEFEREKQRRVGAFYTS